MNAPHTHPDIRKERIENAELHIQHKRTRRLVLLHSFKEKQSAKLEKLHGKELERFNKRVEMVEKALARINDAIESAEKHLHTLNNINHGLVNIEREIDEI